MLEFGVDMAKELVKRTVLNLQFIEGALKDNQTPDVTPRIFEVTQLINSMLGAIIAPYASDTFREADSHWDMLCTVSPLNERRLKPLRDLGSMARMTRFLRNAFAHGNFHVIEHDGAITAIELWSDQVKQMQIDISDLRTLTLSLAALILSNGATTMLTPGALKINPIW